MGIKIVVVESCGYPGMGNLSAVQSPIPKDFSLGAKRKMDVWKVTAGLWDTGGWLPSIALEISLGTLPSWLFSYTANLLVLNLN